MIAVEKNGENQIIIFFDAEECPKQLLLELILIGIFNLRFIYALYH
jgi:hypothetical protein